MKLKKHLWLIPFVVLAILPAVTSSKIIITVGALIAVMVGIVLYQKYQQT